MATIYSDLNVGDIVTLGKYAVNSGVAEDITWIVVHKNYSDYSGNLTLISEKILDCKVYGGDANTKVPYDQSPISSWLNSNDGFLKDFTSQDINKLSNTNIKFDTATLGITKTISQKVFLIGNEAFDYFKEDTTTIANDSVYCYGYGSRFVKFGANMSQECYDSITPGIDTCGVYTYEGESRGFDEVVTNRPRYITEYWWWWNRYTRSGVIARDFFEGNPTLGQSHTPDAYLGSSYGYFNSEDPAGIRPLINISLNTYIENVAPTAPSPVNNNATNPKTLNDQVIITWGASTDVNGDTLTYDLYFFDGKDWVEVKGGISDLTYTHTIPITSHNCTTAQYKVRAYDGQLYSDFTESNTFTLYGVQPMNYPPTITSPNGDGNSDLGELTTAPTIVYTVDDEDAGDTLSISSTLDDNNIDSVSNAIRNHVYTLDLSSTWSGVSSDETHTLVLSVTDGIATSSIKFLFTKYVKPTYFPTISGIDTNLGSRDYIFTQSYSVDDEDETKTLGVTISIDNTILNTISSATRNHIYTIDFSSLWAGLAINEPHKITISVTDGTNTTKRMYNFYKGNGTNHAPTITLL